MRITYGTCSIAKKNRPQAKIKKSYAYTAGASGRISAMPKGTDISDSTAKKAMAAAQLRTNIELIERAARQADDEIDGYILRNVTEGAGYTYLRHAMNMPCGRNKFYKARRKFFYILYKNRGN